MGATTGSREKSWGPSSAGSVNDEAEGAAEANGGAPWALPMPEGVHSSLAELASESVGAPLPVVRIKAADTGVVPSTEAKAMDLRAVDDMGRTGGGGQSGSCDTRMREASSMLRPYGCQQIFVHSGPFTGDAEVGVVRTKDRLGGRRRAGYALRSAGRPPFQKRAGCRGISRKKQTGG